MKSTILKSLALSLGLGAASVLNAQNIPNADFESWNSTTRDSLSSWKATLGLKKVSGVTGFAGRVETLSSSDIASLVAGNISCITGCTGNIPAKGIPISTSGAFNISFSYRSSAGSQTPVIAVAFIGADGNVIGGSAGVYFSTLNSGVNSFTSKSISSLIVTNPFSMISSVPSTAKEILVGFFPEIPTSGAKTVGSFLEIDNLAITIGGSSVTVPNNAFENWISSTTNLPNGWNTSENYLKGSVDKATPGSNSNSALQLKTGTLLSAVTSGSATLGSVVYDQNGNVVKYVPSFKVDANPLSIHFDYKYAPANNSDSAYVEVILTKNKAGVTTKVGGTYALLSAQNTYKSVSVPVVLLSGETSADSAIIEFNSSRGEVGTVTKAVGSTLTVDNVRFTYDVAIGIESLDVNAGLKLYPNPSNGFINVENANAEDFVITILTTNGKLVKSFVVNSLSAKNVDLTSLSKGLYIVKFEGKNANYTTKLTLN